MFFRPQQRGRGEPARRDTAGARPPSYLSRHAKHNSSTLAKEARDVVKSVKALIEEERKCSYTVFRIHIKKRPSI